MWYHGSSQPAGVRKRSRTMQKLPNYQDQFLAAARRERCVVTVFLMNGFQLKGVIRGFDSFVVLVESEGRQQMIFKHAISTVAPPRPLELGMEE
jgi:host factor-I protein